MPRASTKSSSAKKPTTSRVRTSTKTTTKVTPNVNSTSIAHKVSNEVEKKSSMFQTLVTVLLIFLVAINVYSLVWTKSIVESSLEKFEAMKVWGQENFDLLKKIMSSDKQKAQYKQQFETMLAQLDGKSPDANNSQPEAKQPKAVTSTLTKEQISALVNWYENWAKNAEIAIVEYSDVQCPFCKREHNAWTIEKVIKNFPWKVKHLFKHFPLSFHPNAEKWAEALECIGEQLWEKGFYDFLKKAYANWYSAIDDLTKLAWTVGANVNDFTKCVDSGKYAQKIKDQQAQWAAMFKISWTPGNVIINLKTGKRVLISWAYPYSKFESTIKSLLQ